MVSVSVTNTGARAGDEVVQMYFYPTTSSVAQPLLRLAGFERIALALGETKTVRFAIGPAQLQLWNREMKRVVEPGAVEVYTGANVQQLDRVDLTVSR